ncbi:unnamed protein product [Onchocerca ochengi]|uniref:Male-enhanced antigen 1 n=1 Tax=Onchocerca ochengi TaxID=42157 RepID=A0A182DZV4_ONCOC|nr:unnamed protein product [Onchocerca ochengi]
MGPSPEQNPRELHDTDSDADGESDDGWHMGYEVEMHGIGIEQYANSGGSCKFSFLNDMSDTKSDSCDESDGERYAGYQSLPTLDGSLVITNTDHGEHTNAIVDKDSDEILSSENKDFSSKFNVPESIELTEDKIECIKKAMSTFILPAPSWAKGITSDNELKNLLEKLKSN